MMKEITSPKILLPYYYSWKINKKNTNFNVCFSYKLTNNINLEKMKTCIDKIVSYRPGLRANFNFKNNEVKYIIHNKLNPIIYELETHSEDEFKNYENKIKNLSHDLHNESLIKVAFIKKFYNNEYEIIFNIHHSIIDGTALDKFIIDLSNLYNDKNITEESTDSHLNSFLILNKNSENINDNYIQKYSNLLNEISINTEKLNTTPEENVITSTHTLSTSEYNKINTFSNKYEISFFNLFLLCWCVFETKLFNKNHCIVNYPVNIRNNNEISGCILNNIYFPYIYNKNSSLSEIISNFKKQIPFLKKLHFISSIDIFDKNDSKLTHFAQSGFAKLRELEVNNQHFSGKTFPQMANSFLGMRFIKNNDSVHFLSESYESILPKYISENLSKRFTNFICKIIDLCDTKLEKIDLLYTYEKDSLLNTNISNESTATKNFLHEKFKNIVEKYGEKIAAVDENSEISYNILDYKSTKLANFLSNQNQNDKPIAILIDNKIEMLISILAVLKSGNTYLPISPDTPIERIKYILTDSCAECILSTKKYFNLLDLTKKVYDLNDESLYTSESPLYSNIKNPSPAYIIYTSGSTGNPKGVVIEHHSVLNLIASCSAQFNITNKDNLSKYSAFGFDASVIEIFLSILNGCTLYFVPEDIRFNIRKINDFFHHNNISFSFLTTKLAELFMELKNNSLKTLLVGGEKLKQFKKNNYKLVNAYGPTEATVLVSTHVVEEYEKNIPIGKPLNNVSMYILDKDMNPCLDEMEGEIYIGGNPLAVGYLNNEELTNEKFLPNPFQTYNEKLNKQNERLYKTGDLGKKLQNGDFLISGRTDFQIKISGYRIELSEIEKQILNYQEISHVAVVAYDDPSEHKYLCAYYESKNTININELRTHLEKHLPNFMIPKIFIQLEKLPINYNGKTDLKALKKPVQEQMACKQNILPRTEIEEKISSMFQEVLFTEKISIDDDFFLLGGNSIKAIQLIAKMQKFYNIDITAIYNERTVEKISKLIQSDVC